MMKYYSGARRSTRGCVVVVVVAALACLLSSLLPVAQALICYRCTILPPQYVGEADQKCSEFDHSERFYVDCPTSTFCMKRITHLRLGKTTTVTYERGCAPQKNVSHVFENKQWHKKQNIEADAYTEGCSKFSDTTDFCYCSRNYCNDSPTIEPQHYISLLVIAVLLPALSFT